MTEKDKDSRSKKQEEEAESGFKVSDRRLFTPEGDPVETRPEPESQEREKKQAAPSSGSDAEAAEKGAETPIIGEGEEGETIDFASFLLSLATSAMAYLGEVPDPATGKTVENLEGAKQMIDIISMLKEKTQGNLEAEESRLIESLLYELRMKYLSKARVINL